MPNRKDLDKVAQHLPVMLWRSDLHLAVANSRALELAGITENTSNPPHGVIGRDEKGIPNGILQDEAIDLVKRKIPVPTDIQITSAMADAIPTLHAIGITGLNDLRLMDGHDGSPTFRALQQLHNNSELSIRVWMCLLGDVLEDAIRIGLMTGMGDDLLRIGHVKLFADGSLGAHTAWLSESYADGGNGISLYPMEDMYQLIRRAESTGLSVAVHAIGDRAIHELVSVFTRLEKERKTSHETAKTPVPHRIEHLQILHTRDLISISELGIIGSVQPRQATDDIILIEKSIRDRGKLAYRFRDMLDRGIMLVFGSDCPVASPNPLSGIHAAITRQREDGTPEKGWYPNQRIQVEEAVRGYTVAPAKATGRWDTLGSLTPGKLADFIVLEKDIYTIDPALILTTRVDLTCIGGRIVYDRHDITP